MRAKAQKALMTAIFSMATQSAAAATAPSTDVITTAVPQENKIKASLLIDTSMTLMEHSLASAGEGMSYSGLYRFDLGVPLSRTLTASLRGGYSQEYSYVLPNQSSHDLTDTRLGLKQSWGEIRKDFTLALGPSLYLPTSQASQDAGLKSAVGFSAVVDQVVGNFDFSIYPYVIYYFYELEDQVDGTPNNYLSLAANMEIDYSFSKSLKMGVTFWPVHSFTYQGTTKDTYNLIYALTYDPNDHLELEIGLSNLKAPALKDNGLDYNYPLFDQAQFMGYFDITIKI